MPSHEYIRIYGIKTCDTCRKALKDLTNAGFEPQFVDLREPPLVPETLDLFTKNFGDRLINRRSLTWRKLSVEDQSQPEVVLLSKFPTLIKRPIVDSGHRMTLGWDAEARRAWGVGT